MTDKVAVIIPFYQEEPGILRRAIESVCAQTGVSNVEVIVVDDGSPVPACEEVRDLNIPQHVSLRVLQQNNAGPGAARNKGLGGVSDDTKYVALLDSDDEWYPQHLFSAVNALEIGYDFYFSNMQDYRRDLSHFQIHKVNYAHHEKILKHECLFLDKGDKLYDLVYTRTIIYTSTVVYRYPEFSSLRFPEHIFMGEDLTFFMKLVTRTDKIVFSSVVLCNSGQGMNIFKKSAWGTDKQLWRILHYMKWRKWLPRNFDLTDKQKEANASAVRRLRNDFIAGILHKARRFEKMTGRDIFEFIYEDPLVLLYFLPTTLAVLFSKFKRSDYTGSR